MDEESNGIYSRLRQDPAVSFAMIALLVLIAIIFGLSFLLFRSSKESARLQNNSEKNGLPFNPLTLGKFTPITGQALSLTLTYNLQSQTIEPKKLEIFNHDVFQDFRGNGNSPYRVEIVSAKNELVYSTSLPLATYLNGTNFNGSFLQQPNQLDTLSILPLFKEGKSIVFYDKNKKIFEKELPAIQKTSQITIPKANAELNKDPQKGPYTIVIIGANYSRPEKFKSEAQAIESLFKSTSPFDKRDDFFKVVTHNIDVKEKTPCVTDKNIMPGKGSKCDVNEYITMAGGVSKTFAQVIVLIDTEDGKRDWVPFGQGKVFVTYSKSNIATYGLKELHYNKMLIKHVLGDQLSHLYTRSVHRDYQENKLGSEDVRSNCTDNPSGESWWRTADPSLRSVANGCDGTIKLFAPSIPDCPGDGIIQISYGNSKSVMSNEWSDCGGLHFDAVETYWIANYIMQYFQPDSDSARCNAGECEYCALEACNSKFNDKDGSGCFVYRGKDSYGPQISNDYQVHLSGAISCQKSSFKNKEEKDKNLCIGGYSGATYESGLAARKNCNPLKGCFCNSGEACGYAGCVPPNSQDKFCGAWEWNYASPQTEKNTCVTDKTCSFEQCCSKGTVSYPPPAYVGGSDYNSSVCKPEKTGTQAARCYKDYNCNNSLKCIRNKETDIVGGCCNAGESWNGTQCTSGSGSNQNNTAGKCSASGAGQGTDGKCRCKLDSQTSGYTGEVCDGENKRCVQQGGDISCQTSGSTTSDGPDFEIDAKKISIPRGVAPGNVLFSINNTGGGKAGGIGPADSSIKFFINNKGAPYKIDATHPALSASLCFDLKSGDKCTSATTDAVTETDFGNKFGEETKFDNKDKKAVKLEEGRHTITICVNLDKTGFEPTVKENTISNNCATVEFYVSPCPKDGAGYYCTKDGTLYQSLGEYCGGDAVVKDPEEKEKIKCNYEDTAKKECSSGTKCADGSICDAGKFCVKKNFLPNGWGCFSNDACQSGNCSIELENNASFICKPKAQGFNSTTTVGLANSGEVVQPNALVSFANDFAKGFVLLRTLVFGH